MHYNRHATNKKNTKKKILITSTNNDENLRLFYFIYVLCIYNLDLCDLYNVSQKGLKKLSISFYTYLAIHLFI